MAQNVGNPTPRRSSTAPVRDGEGGSPVEGGSRWNVQGAFPLLLIGAALLAYGLALAVQSPSPTIGRFEIWEVVIVVSSTLIGAGIFSLLYAAEPPTEAPGPRDAPAASGSTKAMSGPARREDPSRTRALEDPPWLEGPDAVEVPGPVAYASSASRGIARPAAPSHAAATLARRAEEARDPDPPAPSGRDEIESALEELEAISKDITTQPSPASGRSAPRRSSVPRCADCGRTLTLEQPGRACRECGRPLCEDCGRALPGGRRGSVVCQRCHPVRS